MNREKTGVKVSVVGICVNLALFTVKLVLGLLSGSVSLVADASNNLSDAGSSLISLISFKIAAKPADRHHPFGHARIEYVASMIVAFIVMLIGFSLFKDSVTKIFAPTETSIELVSTLILVVMIIAKLLLGLYYRREGKRIGSEVILAASADSFSDCIATGAVLVSMCIYLIFKVNIDAYVGAVVSVIIMIAGAKIMLDTKDLILGEAPDEAFIDKLKEIIAEYPEILGVHDMLVHSYGHGKYFVSFHAEVDGAKDVFLTHDVIDNVEKSISRQLGTVCTVHLDPIVTDDEKVAELREKVVRIVKTLDERMNIHDFRFVSGVTHSNLIFDIAVPFEMKDSDDVIIEKVSSLVSVLDPLYFCVIEIDRA
jgi:cation diffusion facilitator family transporter